MRSRYRGELSLFAAAVLWGSTFVLVKDALGDISPVLYLTIRFAIAAVLMLGLARRWPSRRMVVGGVATGLFVGVGMILQTVGLKYTTASNVGFLTSLYIPLVPFVAALVYQTRTGWREALAIVLATAGIGLMSIDPATLSMNFGDVLTVGAALMFAFQIVFVKRFSTEGEAIWMAWFQIAMTAVVSAAALPFEERMLVVTPRLVWALVITIFGATLAAYLLQSYGQRYTSANRAALIFATEPVFAGLTGYLYLGERMGARGWLGGALVLAAVLMAELKPGGQPEHSSK
jgi:drug/metabolite transporter (DMT)-like permease